MAQWVIGYVVSEYVSMTEIPLDVPGPLRRINSGFYIADNTTVPHPLTPVITADAAGEVQISDPTTPAGKRAIKIHLSPILDRCSDMVIFLFVEIELDYPGTKHVITA